MKLDLTDLSADKVYRVLISAVVPRPIAWVSTISENGVPNLAPFSYFTAVCSLPPTLLFCPGIPSQDGREKDTLRNIRATGNFVVQIPEESTAEAMNRSAIHFPFEVSEFEYSGITPIASDLVAAPRVAEARVAFECRLQQIVTVNAQPGGGSAVFGEVLRMHLNDELWDGNELAIDKFRPIGRLGGPNYCRLADLFQLDRPEAPK